MVASTFPLLPPLLRLCNWPLPALIFSDIGGESTRPFAAPVPICRRTGQGNPPNPGYPSELSDIPISIDTYKAEVAQAALDAGANLINDISALRFDLDMVTSRRPLRVPVILMHMQGQPQDMQVAPRYNNLVAEIKTFLARTP